MAGKRGRGVSTGMITVIVMFAVIAMTLLAVLTLSTASQEKKLGDAYTASVAAYWQADTACAQQAEQLARLWAAGADAETLQTAARDLGADTRLEQGRLTVSWQQIIDDARVLSVALELGETFTITAWQTLPRNEDAWQPDDRLPVYQGEPAPAGLDEVVTILP